MNLMAYDANGKGADTMCLAIPGKIVVARP